MLNDQKSQMLALRLRPPLVKFILLVGGGNILIGFVAGMIWALTGRTALINLYFTYEGALFLVAFAALEFRLCIVAYRSFSPGDYLKPAWLLIAAAAGCRLGGFVLSELFGKDSYLNPLRVFSHSFDPESMASIRQAGLDVGGPLAFVLLSCGLFLVRRACRRNGLLGRLRFIDIVVLALTGVFVVLELYDGLRWMTAHGETMGLRKLLSLTTEPILAVLLYLALVVLRSTQTLAGGLIANCWASYSAAALLTVVGDAGLWATNYSYVPWSVQTGVWYVWFFASTAFALGPAFQVEAIRWAEGWTRSAGNPAASSRS